MKIYEIINNKNWCVHHLYEFDNKSIDILNSSESINEIAKKADRCCLGGFCYKVTSTFMEGNDLIYKIANNIANNIAPSSTLSDALRVIANFNDHSDTTWEIIKELCKELDV